VSNVYWAFIAAAAMAILLGTLEHFGALFLMRIATARAFLSIADFCLLFAIAIAVGSMMQRQAAQQRPAEPEPEE
jgi:hypothetical protein